MKKIPKVVSLAALRAPMPGNFSYFLKLILPTLCLCFLFSGLGNRRIAHYQEVFGAGDYYLALDFDSNPLGLLNRRSPETRVRFSGVLVRGETETQVAGYRFQKDGTIHYVMDTGEGKLEGQLVSGKTPCQAKLAFAVKANGRVIDGGRLHAGFCYGTASFFPF